MGKYDDHVMTWYDNSDSESPWYDHGKIMAWQACCSNPSDLQFSVSYQTLKLECVILLREVDIKKKILYESSSENDYQLFYLDMSLVYRQYPKKNQRTLA